jgi:hypothetical protein
LISGPLGAITEQKIATDSITSLKIANETIEDADIKIGAITEQKIATDSITTTKLFDKAVTEEKIAPSTTEEQVLTTKLVEGALVTKWATLVPSVESDRNVKSAFVSVSPFSVLERLMTVPISTWSYKSTPGVTHIGPMAQDFAQAFGFGDDNRRIGVVDAQGVALASIQALYRINTTQQGQIAALKQENLNLSARLARIEARLGISAR